MSWEGLVMILNKSLFNLGIFKNTIYRFKWGSLLYFVALFFSVPFMLFVADFDRLVERVIGSSYYIPTSIILRSDYLTLPMLLAVAVPTVVAVLVFNNVHSSKQGIFTHGLPSDRRANYISNIAAAFVLMSVPVLLNGAILMIMSFGKFGQIISSMSVLYWIGLNLNMLFVMFSVAVFSAFLTGNIAAHIGINVFLHLIPMIIGWAIYIISDQFLYGFHQSGNFIGSELIANSPVVWLFGRSLSLIDKMNENAMPLFAKLQTWIYVIGAIGMYALGYVLYKKRKIEACGDVSAFKIFSPILKYAVVAGAAIALFGILTSMELSAVAVFVVVLVLCAIVYFAAEMLMNKSFKVFKSAYKGFCGFVVCSAVFIGFFAYTSVFGYETRVPAIEDIEGASVQERWRETLSYQDPQLIEDTLKIHKELIKDIPVVEDKDSDFMYLHVFYKLKNGENMQRQYRVTHEMYDKAMSAMYKFKDYKLSVTELDNVNIENIDTLMLRADCSDFSYNIALNDDASQLMEAIKKDVEQLSYKEMMWTNNALSVSVHFDCTAEENEKLKYFKETGYKIGDVEAKYAVHSFNLVLNSNYKNTYDFLKEKGYYDHIIGQLGQSLVICKKPIYRAGELYSYKGDEGMFAAFLISFNDCVDITPDDEKKLAEMLTTNVRNEADEGKSYMVFARSRDLGNDLRLIDYAAFIKAEDMPDYLKAYVEE